MLLLLSLTALAADPIAEARAPVQPEQSTPGGFSFLGLYQARAGITDVITTNPLLDGQVIGVLGGTNGTTVYAEGVTDVDGDGVPDEDLANATWVEQRLNGFFTYAPQAVEGRASLTAGFEIDFLYGDSAYGVGGNAGGGFGADSVNLQTRRLHADFRPDLGADRPVKVTAGLQFVADGVYDPTESGLDDLTRTGGGLRFFGSEAAGVTVFGRVNGPSGERMRYRLGGYTLSEGGVAIDDDISLLMADIQARPTWNVRLGGHVWYLRDNGGGTAGALGSGPTSDLSALQGGPQLDLDLGGGDPEVDADLVWLTVDASRNHALTEGRLGLSAAATANVGRLYITEQVDIAVNAWLLDGQARYRWARGSGSVIGAEVLVDSRDGTDREVMTGIVTGNSYGVVGAMWSTHGSLLLFPDPQAINRQIAVVSDVSNRGSGMLAAALQAGWDLSPNRLNVTLGLAHARSPEVGLDASEANLRLSWSPMPLLKVGAAGARVVGTDFDADPWLLQTTLEWIAF